MPYWSLLWVYMSVFHHVCCWWHLWWTVVAGSHMTLNCGSHAGICTICHVVCYDPWSYSSLYDHMILQHMHFSDTGRDSMMAYTSPPSWQLVQHWLISLLKDINLYYMCETSIKSVYTCITGVWITCVIHLKYHTCITHVAHFVV